MEKFVDRLLAIVDRFDTLFEACTVSLSSVLLSAIAFTLVRALRPYTDLFAIVTLALLFMPPGAWVRRAAWLSGLRAFLLRPHGGVESERSFVFISLDHVKPEPVAYIVSLAIWLAAGAVGFLAWQMLVLRAQLDSPIEPAITIVGTPTSTPPVQASPLSATAPNTPIRVSRHVLKVSLTESSCGGRTPSRLRFDIDQSPDPDAHYWVLRTDEVYSEDPIPQGPPASLTRVEPHPSIDFDIFVPVCNRRYQVVLLECNTDGNRVIRSAINESRAVMSLQPADCVPLNLPFDFRLQTGLAAPTVKPSAQK